MRPSATIAFCIFAATTSVSYGNPITMEFSGTVLSSYSTPSWVGSTLSGSFTIYPANFAKEFTSLSPTRSNVYTFLGPAYGLNGSSVIDYSIALPDGSIYNAPHEGEYAESGGVTVTYQYKDGPGQETYQVGLQIQPLDRSYQSEFAFVLQNDLVDGRLVVERRD